MKNSTALPYKVLCLYAFQPKANQDSCPTLDGVLIRKVPLIPEMTCRRAIKCTMYTVEVKNNVFQIHSVLITKIPFSVFLCAREQKAKNDW